VNGLSTSVTTINYSAPSSSVPEAVTEGGAVDDGTAILARCTTTTPAGNPRALMFDEVSRTATEPSYDFGGDALQVATSVHGLSIMVTANRGGNGARLWFLCGCSSGSRDCDWGVDPKDCPRLERPTLFDFVECDRWWHCT